MQKFYPLLLSLLVVFFCISACSPEENKDISTPPITTPSPPINPLPPTTSTFPTGVLGLAENNWRINSHTGPPSNSTYWNDILASGANFETYYDPNYFYTDGIWTYFKCWRGTKTSVGSSNPRVELRELNNGIDAKWDGSRGTHSMTLSVKVDKLPRGEDGKSGALCFGQIHGPSQNSAGVKVDDVVRLQFYGKANQSTGAVSLKISGFITEEILGGSKSFSGYSLRNEYTFTIKYENSTISIFNGTALVLSQKMNTSCDGNYFKCGNYLQSVKGMSFDNSYGLVGIKNLKISHL